MLKTSVNQWDFIINGLDSSTTGGANIKLNKKLTNSKSEKLSKSRNSSNNRSTMESEFLTLKAKKAFNHLKQAFI